MDLLPCLPTCVKIQIQAPARAEYMEGMVVVSVRDDSKKIIQHFLEHAIECGDLRQEFRFQYNALSVMLSLQDGNYCRVCCQYLKEQGYIYLDSCADEDDPDNKDMAIHLKACAIDFLESPT